MVVRVNRDRIRKKIQSQQQKISHSVGEAAQSLLAFIKKDILSGRRQSARYSSTYAITRKERGLQSSKVDLFYDGKMLNSMFVKELGQSKDGHSVTITFGGDQQEKAKVNQKRYNFFTVRPYDRSFFVNTIKKLIKIK